MNNTQNIKQQNTKWATFTYIGNEIKFVTKLFKNANIKRSYRANNTIGRPLGRNSPKDNKYDNAGVYKLKCTECEQYYVRQTGRNFKTRYKEHVRDTNNRYNIGYAEHVLNTGHSYGSIQDTMQITKVTNRGPIMDTIEKHS
jgi:predicted GIY-YIG superfamily endonuclease